MARPNPLSGSFVILGSRVPRVVGLLIGLTLVASIAGAVTSRNGFAIVLQWVALAPDFALRGQLWRLVTWVFFERDPLSLIFACLALFWFGRDLCSSWGPTRFLLTYLGLAVLTGVVVCLVSLVWPGLGIIGFLGPWPLVDGLIVAWAILHPHRDIFVYFVLPLRGRNLIYATVAGTVLYALFAGVAYFVPHFVAEGIAFFYMRESFVETLWLKLRYRLNTRGWRRRASHLRPVDRASVDEKPKWLH